MKRLILVLVTATLLGASGVRAEQPPNGASEVSAQIDAFLARHWDENGITPAEITDD